MADTWNNFPSRQKTVQSTYTIDYDVDFPDSTRDAFDEVHCSVLSLRSNFRTKTCLLYETVGRQSKGVKGEEHHILFMHKAIVGKVPEYLSCLLNYK